MFVHSIQQQQAYPAPKEKNKTPQAAIPRSFQKKDWDRNRKVIMKKMRLHALLECFAYFFNSVGQIFEFLFYRKNALIDAFA